MARRLYLAEQEFYSVHFCVSGPGSYAQHEFMAEPANLVNLYLCCIFYPLISGQTNNSYNGIYVKTDAL